MDRNPGAFVAPSLDEPMHAVVGAVISAPAQFLEQPLGRAALPLRQLGFLLQDLRQNLDPFAELRRGLNPPRVLELGLVAADDLAHRRARHRQRAHDLLDRAVLLKIGASYLADLVHANHPHQALPGPSGPKGRTLTQDVRGGRNWTRKSPLRGSILQAILQAKRRGSVFGPATPVFCAAGAARCLGGLFFPVSPFLCAFVDRRPKAEKVHKGGPSIHAFRLTVLGPLRDRPAQRAPPGDPSQGAVWRGAAGAPSGGRGQTQVRSDSLRILGEGSPDKGLTHDYARLRAPSGSSFFWCTRTPLTTKRREAPRAGDHREDATEQQVIAERNGEPEHREDRDLGQQSDQEA